MSGYLIHYGIPDQKRGIQRWQNEDGSYIDNYLSHHGVLHMKWGKRNGPPYPLNSEGKDALREQRKQDRKERRAEKRKETKFYRDTVKYNKHSEKRSEIDERRANNYVKYGTEHAIKSAAMTMGLSTPAIVKKSTNEDTGLDMGSLGTGMVAAGALTAAVTAVSTVKAVNKKKKVDDIKYNKLSKKMLKYEMKYKTKLSQINNNRTSYDHKLARRDISTMSNRDLSKAIERKRLENAYNNPYKSSGEGKQFATDLTRDVIRSFSSGFATQSGKNTANKIFKDDNNKRTRK